MSGRTVDPVTLTVIWNSLISIAEELGITLRHTAFSEGVREGDDFATALFDRNGVMLAQGNFSPGHLGSMPAMAKHVLGYFPVDKLKPGDSILVNDSFLGAGHFPDTYQIMPVFLDGRVIGFVCCSAHQVDMGGAAPGSQKVHGVTEAFQEGLRILPVRFVREGKIDDDILRIVLGNVRMPDKVRGDLLAQHTANLTASVRFAKLFRDYGTETLETALRGHPRPLRADHARALAQVPAGTYSFEDRMDDYGPGTEPIRMAVDITFDGKGEVEFDFSRSSDAVPAAINSYINYTRAYAVFTVKTFCNALEPQTEGSMRPIKLKVREGSFFNPKFPAPSGGRPILQIRIFDTINGALAKAMPHRAMGAFSHWSNPNIGGIDDRTGKPFVMYDVSLAGYGGQQGKDGAEGLCPVMNCSNIPVEVHETNSPVRVHRFGFIPDTGRRRPVARRLRHPQRHRAPELHGRALASRRPARVRALRHLRRQARHARREHPQSRRQRREAAFQGNARDQAGRCPELPAVWRRRLWPSREARAVPPSRGTSPTATSLLRPRNGITAGRPTQRSDWRFDLN